MYYHEMLAGEEDPEAEQHRVEDALSDVAEQQHERHVDPQRQHFHRHCSTKPCSLASTSLRTLMYSVDLNSTIKQDLPVS